MSRLRRIFSALRLPLCALALGISLTGCASMQGASTDPNACVGPVDYCQPFFGS
ncbi:pectin methylesterase-like acyl-CoA thioesterase [Caballeronia udeis]|uniref:Pectin methylesterase-like acyl-CoA thioesterase n=1 Tax=Caballeronia udeis TaxID=1232866 RepID=A0ABW8MLZ7_9BURK